MDLATSTLHGDCRIQKSMSVPTCAFSTNTIMLTWSIKKVETQHYYLILNTIVSKKDLEICASQFLPQWKKKTANNLCLKSSGCFLEIWINSPVKMSIPLVPIMALPFHHWVCFFSHYLPSEYLLQKCWRWCRVRRMVSFQMFKVRKDCFLPKKKKETVICE